MSAVLDRRTAATVRQSPKAGTVTDETGGLYVTVEQLSRFGDGDAARGRKELRAFLAPDQEGPSSTTPTVRPPNVRLADARDEAAILELLLVDLRENAELIAPVDEERVLETIQVGTRLRGGFAGVIDGPEGKPVAVTILHPMQWWWSRGWYFVEAVAFVHPDHRVSRHSAALLAFGKWVSEQQTKAFGYRVYFLCGVLGLKNFWLKTAMYRRRFMQVGSAFLWPAPNSGARP